MKYILILLLLLFPVLSFAQRKCNNPPYPPNHPCYTPPPVPINGGIGVMILGGMTYGFLKLKIRNKWEQNVQLEKNKKMDL